MKQLSEFFNLKLSLFLFKFVYTPLKTQFEFYVASVDEEQHRPGLRMLAVAEFRTCQGVAGKTGAFFGVFEHIEVSSLITI